MQAVVNSEYLHLMTRTCSLQQPACGGYHHYTLQHCSAAAHRRGLKGRTATALSLDRFNNRFLYAALAQILDMGGIMKFGPGSGGPRWEVGWFYKNYPDILLPPPSMQFPRVQASAA